MSAGNEHPSREQLDAFARGQLAESDLVLVSAHVESCETCCNVIRELPADGFEAKIRAAHQADGAADPGEILRSHRDRPLPKELLEHPKYEIGRFLGSGGMGAVYQAEHRLMDRVVALKIIHDELSKHPRVLERFRKEVKAAGRLSHPNIVAAYDADSAGDVHFLVMEYVDGISLAQFVARRGPLDVSVACNFIRQAARGLQHAFEAGMVHRDIKPHNLMLTRKGQIKILDFGLARMASESLADLAPAEGTQDQTTGLTRMGEIMGTPDFMAPEQIVNPAQADIRADLYSLGCTLYFLLTGRSPFWDESGRVQLTSRKYRPPRPITEVRSDLPAELITVLNKMLAREPAQRYQTPAEFQKPLTAFIKAPTAATTPEVEVPESREPAMSEVRHAAEETRPQLPGFAAQCPFCQANMRVPDTARRGASIRCRQCGSFFTVAPVEEDR